MNNANDFLAGAEVYDKKAVRAVNTTAPRVTVNALPQRFTINQPAYDRMGRPAAVELLYNRERHSIGFRAIAPDAPTAHQIRRIANSNSALVNAKSFCGYYGINFRESAIFDPAFYGQLMVIDLREAIKIPRRKRPPRIPDGYERWEDVPDDAILTSGQAACMVGVHYSTIRTWRTRGLLPAVGRSGSKKNYAYQYRAGDVRRVAQEWNYADQ